MCGPDDRFFSGAQRCYAILEPSACDAFRACEQTVLHRCVVSGCPVYTSPSIFCNSLQETEIHHLFSDDVGCDELQLVCHCEVCRCQIGDEDEDAAGGFLRGSV